MEEGRRKRRRGLFDLFDRKFRGLDALTKDGDNPSLYCLSDGERVHAACQVSRLMMSKFPSPILRARFVVVSPVYELGLADAGQYAQMLVALFSGIVWLSRDTLTASHIRFFLKSPGRCAILRGAAGRTPLSPFSKFTIEGALIECSLKEVGAGGNRLIPAPCALTFAITHFANALLGCAPLQQAPVGAGKNADQFIGQRDRGKPAAAFAGALSRMRLGAIQWLILCAAVLVIAIMLGTGYFALQFRERALEVAERELNNSALLLSRHFDQQLSDLQHVHDDVVAYMRADGVDTADEFEKKMSTLSAHEMLRARLAALPHVGALNLFNAKGWLINSSEMWPVPDVSIADRRYFQEFTSGQADARRDRRAGREQGDEDLDHGLRAQDRRPQRRDHRLCQPRRRAQPFRGFRRVAGAEQRHRDLDDPPRRHHHRPLSRGRQR